jgi:hypothetical protein
MWGKLEYQRGQGEGKEKKEKEREGREARTERLMAKQASSTLFV